MANLDMPSGAVPKGPVLRATSYLTSSIVYPGDFVEFASDGTVAAADATSALCGVALSYAASGASVLVADDPNQRFIVQADEADVDAQTDINLNANFVATAGNTTYRVSRMELDSSTINTTDTLPLKIIKIYPVINNALGAQVKLEVKINNHQLGSHTGTAGV